MKYPLVSIVIVTYGKKQYIKECLLSLTKLTYPKKSVEVFVVDGKPTKAMRSFIQERYQDVSYIESKQSNYAHNNNCGMKRAQGEYVVLLNDDTKVTPRWLTELVKVAEAKPKAGAIGSKILFMDGQIQSAGHEMTPTYQWVDRGIGEEDNGQYDKMEIVDSVCGASVLYRAKALKKCGYLDEDFMIFLEDVDMAFRLRSVGYQSLYNPKSVVYHKYHGTLTKKQTQYLVSRNRLLLAIKHDSERIREVIGNIFDEAKLSLTDDEKRSIFCDAILKVVETYKGQKRLNCLEHVIDGFTDVAIYNRQAYVQKNTELEIALEHIEMAFQKAREEIKQKDADMIRHEKLFKNVVADLEKHIRAQNQTIAMEIGESRAAIKNKEKEVERLAQELVFEKGKRDVQIGQYMDSLEKVRNEKAERLRVAEKDLEGCNQEVLSLRERMQREVGTRDAVIGQCHQRIAQLEVEQEELKERHALEIKTLTDAISELNEKMSREIGSRDAQIGQYCNEVDECKTKEESLLQQLSSAKESRETEVTELKEVMAREIGKRDVQISNAIERLEEIRHNEAELIERMAVEHDNRLKEIEVLRVEMTKEIAERDAEIKQHVHLIDGFEKKEADLVRRLADEKEHAQQEIAALKNMMIAEIEPRDDEIANLKQEVERKSTELEEKQDMLDENERKVAFSEERVEKLRSELHDLQMTLKKIMNTPGYKLFIKPWKRKESVNEEQA